MASVTGVLETALYVDDLERAARFYEELFGFEALVTDPRLRAYDVAGEQVLLLFERGGSVDAVERPGGTIPGHDGSGSLHLAFSIAADRLDAWRQRLADRGVEVESEMSWSRGGHSLYFRDPDGHLLELVTPGCWTIY